MSATIKDIAKETGLGLATISSYLNGGTVREKNRIKIEEAIKKLKFEVNEVARGLKTNKTKTIGIVIPELNNIFCAEIITEIEDILRNHGYATMICDCRTDMTREKEAVEFLYKKRVDGLIHIPVSGDGTHLDSFKNGGKPIVIIDRKIEEDSCDFVLVNNELAVFEAVNLLLDLGHEKIGIISGPKEIYTARERLNGYIKALNHASIKVEESLIAYGDYTISSGALCLMELLNKKNDMTALLITNYEMTVGGMIGIHEMGIHIPKELSVIGYDNNEFARASNPKLVVITQPTKDIGRNAAKLMIEKLEDNRMESKSIILESTITKGGSIANI